MISIIIHVTIIIVIKIGRLIITNQNNTNTILSNNQTILNNNKYNKKYIKTILKQRIKIVKLK